MYIKISWILRNQLILFQNRIDQKFIMEKGILIKAEKIKKEKHSFCTKTYIFLNSFLNLHVIYNTKCCIVYVS